MNPEKRNPQDYGQHKEGNIKGTKQALLILSAHIIRMMTEKVNNL